MAECRICGGKAIVCDACHMAALENARQQQRGRTEKIDLWSITFVRDILKLLIEAVRLAPSKEVVLLSSLKGIADKCEAALKELEAK